METETLREVQPGEKVKKEKTKRVASQKQLDSLAIARAKKMQAKKDKAVAVIVPSEPKPIKKAKRPIVVAYESESDGSGSDGEPPAPVIEKKAKVVPLRTIVAPEPEPPQVQQIFIRRAGRY